MALRSAAVVIPTEIYDKEPNPKIKDGIFALMNLEKRRVLG
jgi:hypothetical protein